MRRVFKFFLAGIASSALVHSVHAADLNLEARLIWGANDAKETVAYRPVDPELADKLNRTFKWKNYFEITNRTAAIALNQSADLKMSDACTIRVKNMGGSRVEVSCIGHGKEVHKGAYTLTPPQWFILGGNGNDNTAWFIGLRSTDAKKAISKN